MRHTFDVEACLPTVQSYGWKNHYEAFSICRNCRRSTVFTISARSANSEDHLFKTYGSILNSKQSLNRHFDVDGYVSVKDRAPAAPPEYVPPNIERAFVEGAACQAIDCHNAAAAMFRLCVDLATQDLLPNHDENGLNSKIRRSLGLRLAWLFANSKLPEALHDLSSCIKDDGNDGAHEGVLTKADTEDVCDFTHTLLERLYTEPARVRAVQDRRAARRAEA